jgi:hypothetical protein
MISKLFAVLAAVLLVGAFALATLVPPEMSLAQALLGLDLLYGLHRVVETRLGEPVWTAVLVPVLVRPVWLLPAAFGLICVGGALSANQPPAQRHHRRS